MSAGRLHQLDALRGIAALSVFVGHLAGVLRAGPLGESILSSRLAFLWNGTAAVDFFFVLSGFVLALPFLPAGRRTLDYRDFLIRRIFRIYPAFWLAIFLSLLLLTLRPGPAGMVFSDWFQALWRAPVGLGQVLRQLTLIGPGISTDHLDPVMWSLMLEMRISLIFPLIVLLLARTSTAIDFVVLALMPIPALLGHRYGILAVGVLPHFFLGALLAKHRAGLSAVLARQSLGGKLALLACGLMLYGHRDLLHASGKPLAGLITALGAAIIIQAVLSSARISAFLKGGVVQFYGDISYSFYLLHLPILIFVAPFLGGLPFPLLTIGLSGLALATATAALSFRFVEMPLQRMGHRVAGMVGAARASGRSGG